jgi:hypothetical protein
MAKRGFVRRMMHAVAAVAIGGSAFQLSGCDPLVRQSLLTGLESTTLALTDTLVSAFFLSLADEDTQSGTGGLTTTKAQ